MKLSGTESVSIELVAGLPPDATDALALRVPTPLAIERDGRGAGNVSVLVLEMHGLGLGWLPPRFDYREVLYRLGVTVGDSRVPAWLALRCDIDRALVAKMAASVIRYPVRRAHIAIEEPGDAALSFVARTDSDHLSATLALVPSERMPAVQPPRRTFVVDRGALFEVPWDERAAPVRARAEVTDAGGDACSAVFGAPITFATEAVVHRGRTHLCGAATRTRGDQ